MCYQVKKLEKSWSGVEDKLPAEARRNTEDLGRTESCCIRKGSGMGICPSVPRKCWYIFSKL